MGRMASVQALRMTKALTRLGWTLARVAGSHHILTRTGHPSVTIPVRKGATLKEGTARSILRQAGIGEDESRRTDIRGAHCRHGRHRHALRRGRLDCP